MQVLFDFLPLVAFFASYKAAGWFVPEAERIYVATGVLLVVTVVQVIVQWLRTRAVSKMLLITAAMVLFFGGLTMWLHDDRFIVWKPSLVYGLFGLAMLVSPWLSGKPLLQRLLEHQIHAPERIWWLANLSWALFWFVLAAVNAVFVLRFSRDAWVNWHTAAGFIVPAFGLLQGLWLVRHAQPVDSGTDPSSNT